MDHGKESVRHEILQTKLPRQQELLIAPKEVRNLLEAINGRYFIGFFGKHQKYLTHSSRGYNR